jgi:hypothetical protein
VPLLRLNRNLTGGYDDATTRWDRTYVGQAGPTITTLGLGSRCGTCRWRVQVPNLKGRRCLQAKTGFGGSWGDHLPKRAGPCRLWEADQGPTAAPFQPTIRRSAI